MRDQLATKPCQCGGTMTEVIHAEKKTRKGWYCPQCHQFDKAVLRERFVQWMTKS